MHCEENWTGGFQPFAAMDPLGRLRLYTKEKKGKVFGLAC
jgi:hypothetical protein